MPWEDYTGRASTGQLATQFADVMLRTADALSARRLPALLARDVAAYAMQDVLDRAPRRRISTTGSRWRSPRAIFRDERFDDYVAALTVAGPLVPVPQEAPMMGRLRWLRRWPRVAAAGGAPRARRPRASRRRPTARYLMGAVRFDPRVRSAVGRRPRPARPLVRRRAAGLHRRGSSVLLRVGRGRPVDEHVIRAVATLDERAQLVANPARAPSSSRRRSTSTSIQITAVVTDGDGRFVTRPEGRTTSRSTRTTSRSGSRTSRRRTFRSSSSRRST